MRIGPAFVICAQRIEGDTDRFRSARVFATSKRVTFLLCSPPFLPYHSSTISLEPLPYLKIVLQPSTDQRSALKHNKTGLTSSSSVECPSLHNHGYRINKTSYLAFLASQGYGIPSMGYIHNALHISNPKTVRFKAIVRTRNS